MVYKQLNVHRTPVPDFSETYKKKIKDVIFDNRKYALTESDTLQNFLAMPMNKKKSSSKR